MEGFDSTESPCIGKEMGETQIFGMKQINPCQLIWYQIFTHSIYFDFEF